MLENHSLDRLHWHAGSPGGEQVEAIAALARQGQSLAEIGDMNPGNVSLVADHQGLGGTIVDNSRCPCWANNTDSQMDERELPMAKYKTQLDLMKIVRLMQLPGLDLKEHT